MAPLSWSLLCGVTPGTVCQDVGRVAGFRQNQGRSRGLQQGAVTFSRGTHPSSVPHLDQIQPEVTGPRGYHTSLGKYGHDALLALHKCRRHSGLSGQGCVLSTATPSGSTALSGMLSALLVAQVLCTRVLACSTPMSLSAGEDELHSAPHGRRCLSKLK